MLPLTILRAIAAAAAGLEPREAHGRPPWGEPRAALAARGLCCRPPRRADSQARSAADGAAAAATRSAGRAPHHSGSAPRRLQMADKMAVGQLTAGAPARRPAPETPPPLQAPPLHS